MTLAGATMWSCVVASATIRGRRLELGVGQLGLAVGALLERQLVLQRRPA